MVVPDGDKTPLEAHDDILSIWLSYANIQKKYTSKADARSTYRHIHNQNIGSKLAASYVEFATFERVEGNAQKSIQILQNGITNKAQPTRDLEYLMQELQEETIRAPKKSEIEDGGRATHVPTTRKRKDAAQKASPKRSKTEQGAVEMKNSYRESKHSAHSSSKETDQVGKKDDGTRRYIRIQRSPRGSTLYKAKTDDASKATEGQERGRPRPLRGKVTALGSKTPRLARVGLTGKPQRVDPTRPLEVEDGSDADNADDTPMKDKQESMRQETSQLCPKLTRMDLSYMMNWDPTKRETPKFPKPKGPPKTSTTSSEDKDGIGGGSASGGSASGGSVSAVTLSSHSNGSHLSDQRASVHSGDSYHSIRTLGSEREKQSVDSSSSRHSVVSPHTATMLSQLNSDFLPLVHENNILRVNAAPYVKLGVIGKGGSCKVYRALSRDCAVLAIKKVKLGHLDEKAVNGYANEIALLKRLQGNPAIIQMYDSEVDIERKAIFVVMELGEVDLNHVLQQQVLLNVNESNGCRSKLNMNFIRLTWQQMLSAVHCIHEERIIHGDLKPANFLFVRGCLKLIDFGIAKAIQSDDTTNIYRDSQIGTLNYMSPEAILDTGSGSGRARMKIGRVSRKPRGLRLLIYANSLSLQASDIWSLGCILYQMVYGRTPFADLHMIQKLQAIVNPKHKIAFPQSADEDAVDAMKRCLQRKPDDRPPIVGNGGLLNEHCFLRSTKSA